MRTAKTDQTGRMPRLIWVLAGRTLILLVLSCRSSSIASVSVTHTGSSGYNPQSRFRFYCSANLTVSTPKLRRRNNNLYWTWWLREFLKEEKVLQTVKIFPAGNTCAFLLWGIGSKPFVNIIIMLSFNICKKINNFSMRNSVITIVKILN